MATHRRGLRPAQWPVRDLLAEQRSRMGALRDPRLYAAVGGLLACGAAATVAFTASDGGHGRDGIPGPMALPAPNAVVPAPVDPAPSDPGFADPAPSRSGGGSAGGAGSDPVPQAWRFPAADSPATATMPADAAGGSASVREIADRVAAELVRLQARPSPDGTVEGLLVVPLQRDGNVTALVKRVRTDGAAIVSPKHAGGRHRAQETSDTGDRDRGDSTHDRDEHDRDQHDRDEHHRDQHDRGKHDRDQHDRGRHSRDQHDRSKHDRTHDSDDDRKIDRAGDRTHRCDEDRKRHRDDDHRKHGSEHDRKHDGGRHHAKAADAGDRDDDAGDDRTAAADGNRHERVRATRTATARPAMALVTSAGDGGHIGGRTIDPDALLAALDDLQRPATSRG